MSRVATCMVMLLILAIAAPNVFADPLDVLGAFDPGWPGFNASVVGLDGIAYLGSWGHAGECPALGVRVIDVHDPTAPTLLTSAAVYRGTTAEHLAVAHFATPAFTGNVLFVGIQRCAPEAPAGLVICDAADPE